MSGTGFGVVPSPTFPYTVPSFTSPSPGYSGFGRVALGTSVDDLLPILFAELLNNWRGKPVTFDQLAEKFCHSVHSGASHLRYSTYALMKALVELMDIRVVTTTTDISYSTNEKKQSYTLFL